MKVTTLKADNTNYGAKRDTKNIKYIVIHYTGNDGDTAKANCLYFQGSNREASAHYFVDDNSIYQSVPDIYTAWHCGALKYYHDKCRNNNSIGVEMCDTTKNKKYDLSEKTKANVIELVRSLMKEYNVPIENVVRHYDVTHKLCPAYLVDEEKWKDFKEEIKGTKKATTTKTTKTTKSEEKAETKTYKKGDSVKLTNVSLYASATSTSAVNRLNGTFYIYDGEKKNGKYRITTKKLYCGKKPAGLFVTGWVKV